MVEIGRALMADPDLLLVDEPTAGLAPIVAGDIYARLVRLNREEGKTILLVDQNIRQAVHIARNRSLEYTGSAVGPFYGHAH